jgi:CubicO group peptidase (beta-lactamase class C family)
MDEAGLTRRDVVVRGALAAAGLALAGRAVPAASARPSALYFPPAAGEWATVSPAAVGWNEAALEEALAVAGRRRSTGVVLLVGGRILAERYWRGASAATGRDVASVQKSITSFLVGALAAEGRLALDDPVSRWLGTGWTHARARDERRIEVRHLLAMTSGLDDDFRKVAAAGKRWYYGNDAYHQLHPVLERAGRSSLQRISDTRLFAPTGMTSGTWRPRFGRDPNGRRLLGLALTPRDLARFGLLALAGGAWNGRRLVPRAYVRSALSTSQPMNPSYGRLWWLNGKASYRLPGPAPSLEPGPLVPSAPQDLVAALGAGDQKIYVVPSLDLVVARQGERAALGQVGFDEVWWRALRAAAPRS